MRRAFTIVELMVVVAVISILLSLVFAGVSGAMVDARTRQAESLCQAVQSGLTAYYAQQQEWPGTLGNRVESGTFPSGDANTYTLSASEVRELVKALVDQAKDGNPLMDISGLFVSTDPGEAGGRGYGYDFVSAIRGTKKSGKKMTTSSMYYGYPDPATAKFRRFKMVYSIPTDSILVSVQ